jgi:hypothetical protein
MVSACASLKLDRADFVGEFFKSHESIAPEFFAGKSFRPKSGTSMYGRGHVYEGFSGSKLIIYTQPSVAYIARVKARLFGTDSHGITSNDFRVVLAALPARTLVTTEWAFDFSPSAALDVDFVRTHGYFGGSRRNIALERAGELRFGTRRSRVFARVYEKPLAHAHPRVEIQLNPAWFRNQHYPSEPACMVRKVFPNHFHFVQVPKSLRRFLKPSDSLAEWANRFRQSGFKNPFSFTRSHPLNKEIESAVERWLTFWSKPFPLVQYL